jgi:hypothetical protein
LNDIASMPYEVAWLKSNMRFHHTGHDIQLMEVRGV